MRGTVVDLANSQRAYCHNATVTSHIEAFECPPEPSVSFPFRLQSEYASALLAAREYSQQDCQIQSFDMQSAQAARIGERLTAHAGAFAEELQNLTAHFLVRDFSLSFSRIATMTI